MAAISKMPPDTTTSKEVPVPEYSPLHYIDMEVRDQSGKGFTATRGLLDSGSQGSCVNQKFSQDVLTDHKLKATPTTLIMADGNNSPAGPITHYDHVTARIAGHEEQLALDTTSLSHPIILGMPWHKKHNPRIDYPNDTLTFDSESCRENCDHYGKTIVQRAALLGPSELRHSAQRPCCQRDSWRDARADTRTHDACRTDFGWPKVSPRPHSRWEAPSCVDWSCRVRVRVQPA